LEKQINPFLRTHVPAVADAAGAHAPGAVSDAVSVLATLREWKNNFK
jgi:hydroxyacylglutathione hydrolase